MKILGKDYMHVYAIVRIDENAKSIQYKINIKEIVRTREEADLEIERLNKTNAGKGCTYFWQLTRLDNR